MSRKINYDKLISLRTFLGDPVNQFVNLANSLSAVPAKKIKKKNGIPVAKFIKPSLHKKKKKKKYLDRKSKIEIEDISDGNL